MKNPDYKYIHYVTYTHNKNGMGVFEIYSKWKVIDTKSKLDDCERIIEERNGFFEVIISSILTVKNK